VSDLKTLKSFRWGLLLGWLSLLLYIGLLVFFIFVSIDVSSRGSQLRLEERFFVSIICLIPMFFFFAGITARPPQDPWPRFRGVIREVGCLNVLCHIVANIWGLYNLNRRSYPEWIKEPSWSLMFQFVFAAIMLFALGASIAYLSRISRTILTKQIQGFGSLFFYLGGAAIRYCAIHC